MYFSKTLLVSLLAAGGLAAPAPTVETQSMAAAVPEWTIKHMLRVCNDADTNCKWTFKINTGGDANTACTMVVKGSKASERNGGPVTCGAFTVTSGWSGQFGAGNGFTTLSVVDEKKKLIAWPSYTDKQLDPEKVVKPNYSFAVQSLP